MGVRKRNTAEALKEARKNVAFATNVPGTESSGFPL